MNKRYIFDALYGVIYLPGYIWEVLNTPELQRLREIRLCNINSLCLTGGANINRFEHAVGTCYLAIQCYESWFLKKTLSDNEIKAFLIAALFHDVANSAFGHTIEYVENYKPENSFLEVLNRIKGNNFTSNQTTLEAVFFGLRGTLADVLVNKLQLSPSDMDLIAEAIEGKGLFGPLISNDIDLDNIDNVFRLAYHIGLVEDKSTAIKIAQSLIIENNKLTIDDDNVYLINEWFKTRKLLYEFLLLNPDEFSGKCMLTEAVENSKKIDKKYPFRWFDTDYDLLKNLSKVSSENENIIQRLMTGDLYGCIGIFSTTKIELYKLFLDRDDRGKFEKQIEIILRNKYKVLKSAMIGIHPILDKNKTERQITIQTTSGQEVKIGTSSKKLLLGIFIKNKDYNMNNYSHSHLKTQAILNDVTDCLKAMLNDENLITLPLYGESDQYGN